MDFSTDADIRGADSMQVKVLKIGYVEVKKAARNRIAEATQNKLCVACMGPLGDKRVICGCHERCYRATLRAIEKGKTTRAKRLEEGKLLEGEPPGRKVSNPVSVDVEK